MKLFAVVSLVLAVALLEPCVAYPRPDPQMNPMPPFMNSGSFSAFNKGMAQSKTHSASDTSTGLTETGLSSALSGSGSLMGSANAQSDKGYGAASSFMGNLQGHGGLFADTQSVAGREGAGAKTELSGFLQGEGGISGGVGAYNAHKNQ